MSHSSDYNVATYDAAVRTLNESSRVYDTSCQLVSDFLSWAGEAGLGNDISVFTAANLDAFLETLESHHSLAYKTLSRVGRQLGTIEPRRKLTGSTSVAQPYSADEVRQILEWARFKQSDKLNHNKAVYVALGLGGGMTSRDMEMLTWGHVHIDSRGVVVDLGGGRVVPIIDELADPLRKGKYAAEDDEHFALWPKDRRTSQKAGNLTIQHSAGVGLRPDNKRLRDTWVVAMLKEGIPQSVIVTAAGLKGLRRYRDVDAELDWVNYRIALHRKAEPVRPRFEVV